MLSYYQQLIPTARMSALQLWQTFVSCMHDLIFLWIALMLRSSRCGLKLMISANYLDALTAT